MWLPMRTQSAGVPLTRYALYRAVRRGSCRTKARLAVIECAAEDISTSGRDDAGVAERARHLGEGARCRGW
jgi:hypothetical protein